MFKLMSAFLVLFAVGLLLVPRGQADLQPGSPAPDCSCSASGAGTPGTHCGNCDDRAITLKIGCTVCCERNGGGGTGTCSQTDGEGMTPKKL